MTSPLHVRLYGRLGDALGRDLRLDREPAGATVGDLRRRIAADHPGVGEALLHTSVRACVADRLVGDDHPLDGVEEAEFFPPLSGG